MDILEQVAREYAKKQIETIVANEKFTVAEDYYIFTYLGRIVHAIETYKAKGITVGIAFEQFISLAGLILKESDQSMVDLIFDELTELVYDRLEKIDSSALSQKERNDFVAAIGEVIPIKVDLTSIYINHTITE